MKPCSGDINVTHLINKDYKAYCNFTEHQKFKIRVLTITGTFLLHSIKLPVNSSFNRIKKLEIWGSPEFQADTESRLCGKGV